MRTTTIVIISLFVAVAVVFNVWPQGLTGWAGTVRVPDASMEPSHEQGDVLLLRRVAVYESDDVVAFPAPGTVLVGRVVGGNPVTGYVVQGDDQLLPYPVRPTGEEIVGRVAVELWPVVGAAAGLFSLVPGTVVAAALGALLVLWSPARLRRRYGEATDVDAVTGRRPPARDDAAAVRERGDAVRTGSLDLAGPPDDPGRHDGPDGRDAAVDGAAGTGTTRPRADGSRSTSPAATGARGRPPHVSRPVAAAVAAVSLVLAAAWSVTTVELSATPATAVVDQADSSARQLLELDVTVVDRSPSAGGDPSRTIRAEAVPAGDRAAGNGPVVTVGRVPSSSRVIARDEVDRLRVRVRHDVEGGASVVATVGLDARLRTDGGDRALGSALRRLQGTDEASAVVVVDLGEADRLVPAGASGYELLLTPSVRLAGADDGSDADEDSFAGRPLVVRVADGTVVLGGAMASSARPASGETVVRDVSASVLGLTTGVVAARVLSVVVLLLLLGLAGVALWAGFLRMPWDRYALRYRSLIQDVPADVVHRGEVVRVGSIAELVAIAAADRRRVRHQRCGDGSHRWSVPTGDSVYVFEMLATGVPVTEESTAGGEPADGDPVVTIHLDDTAGSAERGVGDRRGFDPPRQPPPDRPGADDRP